MPSPARARRRALRRALIGLVAVLALGLAWLAVDLVRIARPLSNARSEAARISRDRTALSTTAGRAAARSALERIAVDAADAEARARRSVPLRLVVVVPGASAQRVGVIKLAADLGDAATAASRAARAAEAAVSPASTPALVPVSNLQAVQGEAAATARTFRRIRRGAGGLWGPLADARRRLDDIADREAETMQDAADALAAVRTFAGGEGARRYLVAGQNNAELRDSGMVLSYAVVRADNGRFTVERSGSTDDLSLPRPVDLPLPSSGTEQLFGSLLPTQRWQSVNATADWPWSCRAMLAMYERATGDRLDGVIAVDVVGLSGLLALTGPVRSQGIDTDLRAANVADVLLRELYAGLPPGAPQGTRREAVAGVGSATLRALEDARPDPVKLAQSLARAAAGGHLRLYSATESEQATFARLGPGGGPAGPSPATAARTFHYSVQDATGTKVDFYVRAKVTFDVTTTRAGNAVVRTTVAVQNAAPTGPPSYALGPGPNGGPPGRYVGRVYLWGPAGSQQADSAEDAGLRASMSVLAADPDGGRGDAKFETVVKGAVREGALRLRLVPQPRLRDATLDVLVNGRKVHSGPWRTVVEGTWTVRVESP